MPDRHSDAYQPTEPETPGTWEERCAALYQVIGALSDAAGVFATSDSVADALDVAAGRGDVEKLLPWPKDGDPVMALHKAAQSETPASEAGVEKEGWIPVASDRVAMIETATADPYLTFLNAIQLPAHATAWRPAATTPPVGPSEDGGAT